MKYCKSCKRKVSGNYDQCPDCNQPLYIQCQHCNSVAQADAKFCSQCGTKLTQSLVANLQEDLQLSTERRHITVMFCDLVGSTGLSTLLDPEDLSNLLIEYRDLCMQMVKKWDGYVADFQGDGVMIYFGYPHAHEDDAQRAIYAALDIVEQVTKEENLALDIEVELAVRIGINSGRAVIGDIGHGEIAESMGIVGETPNIAAKLQSHASNNQIIISETTYRNVKDFFNCDFQGKQQIKGVNKSVAAYTVNSAVEQVERFLSASQQRGRQITGRSKELAQLKKIWRSSQHNQLKTVTVVGEAGIGKSRLVWEFRQWIETQSRKVIVFNCSPYHAQTALYPFIEVISRGSKDEINTRARLYALMKGLNCFDDQYIDQTINLLVNFVYGQAIDTEPEKYKNQIYNTLVEMAQVLANQSSLFIVVEDLHWIDPTTWDFFLKFLETKSLTNICLLATSRDKSHLELPVDLTIPLDLLTYDQSAELIKNIIDDIELPAHLLNQLINSCNGNPLYLEESARYLSEQNIFEQDSTRQKLHLVSDAVSFAPESLHDLFMSRLDKLSQEKWLAQLASAIGSQFELTILKTIAQIEVEHFELVLKRLIDADILRQVDQHDPNLFEFKHVLLRNATHDALLRTQRQLIHQKIIDAYQQLQPQLQNQQPELLAYHHAQAGNNDKAVIFWQLAGTKAQRLSANIEAVSHFRKAFDLLSGDKQTELKLELLIQLGPSLMAVESWASPEVEALYRESINLSQRLKDKENLFTSLRGLWGSNFLRGDLTNARDISTQLQQLARARQSNEFEIESLLSRAMENYWLGNYSASQTGLNKVADLYDRGKHKDHAYVFSVDPGVVSLFYQSRNLWALGFIDQALDKVKASIELARRNEHYPSLTWGLGFYAAVCYERGEFANARQIAEQGVTLSQEHDFPLWEAWGYVLLGASLTALKQDLDGLKDIERGVELYRSTGAEIALPYFYSLKAESNIQLRRYQTALEAAVGGLAIVEEKMIDSSKPELLRLKALATSKINLDDRNKILSLLQNALEISKQQQAKTVELRILLSQLEIMCEKQNHVLHKLSGLYQEFTEGLQTLELIKTRNLLDGFRGDSV